MAAVASPSTPSVFETPTKKAVASFDDLSLDSPFKSSSTLDKLIAARAEESKEVVNEDPLEEYRARFVGDVDLDEKDEPLLKETQRRFVLFPIQYREVRSLFSVYALSLGT